MALICFQRERKKKIMDARWRQKCVLIKSSGGKKGSTAMSQRAPQDRELNTNVSNWAECVCGVGYLCTFGALGRLLRHVLRYFAQQFDGPIN